MGGKRQGQGRESWNSVQMSELRLAWSRGSVTSADVLGDTLNLPDL